MLAIEPKPVLRVVHPKQQHYMLKKNDFDLGLDPN
jgi:hypothetical protein